MYLTVDDRRHMHLDNCRHAMFSDAPPLHLVLLVLVPGAIDGFGVWAAARHTGCVSHGFQLLHELHAADACGGAGHKAAEARVLHLDLDEVDPINRLRLDDPVFDTCNLYMHHLLEDDGLHVAGVWKRCKATYTHQLEPNTHAAACQS
jgi:hypothetical protein